MKRRTFLKRSAVLASAGLIGGSYGYGVEPGLVEYTRVPVQIPGLPESFNNFKLVQLSDFHIDDGLFYLHLPGVIERVNAIKPDAVAITGDFVSHDPLSVTSFLSKHLSRIKATFGVYAVPGNHDHWTNIRGVRKLLEESNIMDLSNRHYTISKDGEKLHLCGIDDALTGHDELLKMNKQIPGEGSAVLLAHEPDVADRAALMKRFSLQISGHSHGGQLRLPGLGALILPPMGEKYSMGLYKIGEMALYVNRGLGCIQPAIRVNCRPEVTELILQRNCSPHWGC